MLNLEFYKDIASKFKKKKLEIQNIWLQKSSSDIGNNLFFTTHAIFSSFN